MGAVNNWEWRLHPPEILRRAANERLVLLPESLDPILMGAPITPVEADQLDKLLGIPPHFWLALEAHWRMDFGPNSPKVVRLVYRLLALSSEEIYRLGETYAQCGRPDRYADATTDAQYAILWHPEADKLRVDVVVWWLAAEMTMRRIFLADELKYALFLSLKSLEGAMLTAYWAAVGLIVEGIAPKETVDTFTELFALDFGKCWEKPE